MVRISSGAISYIIVIPYHSPVLVVNLFTISLLDTRGPVGYSPHGTERKEVTTPMATRLDAIAGAVRAQLVAAVTAVPRCVMCQAPVDADEDLCWRCIDGLNELETEEREARFRLSHRHSRPAA